MSIGEKLKNCRKKAGFTQEYVSEQINVSRQTISNWENGKTLPDIYSLISLSDLYNISLDHLIKGDTSMIKNFKAEQTMKERISKLVIIGSVGIILFACGHNNLFPNSHISSLFMGAGTGFMISSIVMSAILYIKNRWFNQKNNKQK